MTTIKSFIQERLQSRMKQTGVLVVYDPECRYRELCLELASDRIHVIDTSKNSIESRETALRTLQALTQMGTDHTVMLVYVPVRIPTSEEEKQRDPFALYLACGKVFPEGDGDEYLNLCLMAKPDHSTEIRRVFSENANPEFAVIDAIGGGLGWPNLQALLQANSAREVLAGILAPSASQKKALMSQQAWVVEARELLRVTLGLKLITRSKSLEAISHEMWRYLLFSELVFELSNNLPESLADVPHAELEARPLIEDLCEDLRNDRRTREIYIDRAEEIEAELKLSAYCSGLKRLGYHNTFPFMEIDTLQYAITSLIQGETDAVRAILARHDQSVWAINGEISTQWAVLQAAFELDVACEDYERQLPSQQTNSSIAVINLYTGNYYRIDRLHREFEQAVSDYIDAQIAMGDLIDKIRNRCLKVLTKLHDFFIRQIKESGWPPVGGLSNSDVFDTLVAPKLQERGHRIAYLLIDALRYEIGLVLEKQLSQEGNIEIRPAFAQLPSITQVGMASLLPEAGKLLELKHSDKGDIYPMLGDQPVTNVNQRMDVIRKRYGQRFSEMPLREFIRSKKDVAATVELLVLRSDEIDAHFENNAETALSQVHESLKRIRVAVNRLKEMAFDQVVIATDHGFVLNVSPNAGDVCSKPSGEWVNIHERCLLGRGTEDLSNMLVATERVGIRGDFQYMATPKSLVTYRAGMLYFHGGLSLQEAIVPVITLQLRDRKEDLRDPTIKLSYKNGSKRITTRLPVIDVTLDYDLFSEESGLEILLEAQDKKGNVIGEAKLGGTVNSSTGTVNLVSGEPLHVTIKMLPEFEGNFIIRAMNPATLTTYAKLELETDYVV